MVFGNKLVMFTQAGIHYTIAADGSKTGIVHQSKAFEKIMLDQAQHDPTTGVIFSKDEEVTMASFKPYYIWPSPAQLEIQVNMLMEF